MTPEAADEILAAAERAGAVALGPGLGRTDGARALVGFLLDRLEKPIVLDADGLWAVAGHLDWVFAREAPTVLTPHAGELGRLLGRPSSWVSANRLDAVQAGADDTGAVVLLKGVDTLVAGPGRDACRRRPRERRASRRPGAATCSRGSSRRSSPRGWRRAARPSPPPPPAGWPRTSRPSATARRG